MKPEKVLILSNYSMLIFFLAFVIAAGLSYGFEAELPMFIVALLHLAQLLLAGFFKVAYVIRLVSQKQLGLAVR